MTLPAPRYSYVYDKACEFLLMQSVISLPINPFELIRQNHWGLVTYSKLCTIVQNDASVDDVAKTCQSNDGFTVCNGVNFCIAYNDTISVKPRVAFTLMHEVGHIVCGHFNGRGTTLLNGEYRVLEEEANFFASNVLAPAAVVTACSFDTPQQLHSACGISFEASKVRLKQLQNFRLKSVDEKIRHAFAPYIKVNSRHIRTATAEIGFDDDFSLTGSNSATL